MWRRSTPAPGRGRVPSSLPRVRRQQPAVPIRDVGDRRREDVDDHGERQSPLQRERVVQRELQAAGEQRGERDRYDAEQRGERLSRGGENRSAEHRDKRQDEHRERLSGRGRAGSRVKRRQTVDRGRLR